MCAGAYQTYPPASSRQLGDGSYDGEWKHGMRDGYGIFVMPDGGRYEGACVRTLARGWPNKQTNKPAMRSRRCVRCQGWVGLGCVR
jgi:hypothetical protein